MPCAACGKNAIATNVTKPQTMILGGQRSGRRIVRRTRGVIFKPPTGKRWFMLGR